MSFPMPPSSSQIGQSTHSADAVLTAINSNPYFIGMMMLFLNLGGRFISMEMTKTQEQFFQNVWVRRFLIFTVLFMGTRNIAIAFWMTIVIVLLLNYLLNENSDLCIYGGSSKCNKAPGPPQQIPTPPPILGSMPPLPTQNINGLNPEESTIYNTLHAKKERASASASSVSSASSASDKKEKDNKENESSVAQTYLQNMFMLRTEGFRNIRF